MNEHHQPFEEIRHYGTEGALKGKNFGQRENWHRYWIIGTGAIFKRYWPARLKRAKPAIKLHLTISLKPPKWLY